MINSRNNVYSLLSSLLEEYHYNIFRSDWDKEVKRMNFSPTLPMISQILMTFGVDNFIAKVPSDKISLLPDHFLALFKNQGVFMTVLVLKSPSFVEITDIQTGNVQKITYQDALGKWTGYIISIKEKSVVTQAPNVCIKGEYSKKFLVGVISMFLISSFYLFYSYRIPVSVIALLLIGITGSFISWLSLQTSLGYYNQKVQSVCHLIKGGDCFSVIHSVGSKLLRNISLSDLSFLFMVYSTITAYCAVFDYNILFINKLLIIPSVAIVVYSIIYQVYLRNYCVICLLTSVCVSLQVCVLENCFPLAFDCNACSINILIGLISICIAFFVKMTLRKMIMSHIEINYKDQIYYNPQVLKYFFSNLRQIDADACTKLPLIPLGGNGEKNIIMILSLSCKYCKDTYKYVRLLKFYHPSEYVIKLLIDTKTLDGISKYVFLKLIEMQETTDLEKACDDIFIYDIPIKRWLKKWGKPQDLSIELLNKKIQIVKEFEEKYYLDDVPALIIGNQVWPTTFYRFDDLLHNIQFIKSE